MLFSLHCANLRRMSNYRSKNPPVMYVYILSGIQTNIYISILEVGNLQPHTETQRLYNKLSNIKLQSIFTEFTLC